MFFQLLSKPSAVPSLPITVTPTSCQVFPIQQLTPEPVLFFEGQDGTRKERGLWEEKQPKDQNQTFRKPWAFVDSQQEIVSRNILLHCP